MPVVIFVKKEGRDEELIVNCEDEVDATYRLIILKDMGYIPLSLNAKNISISFNKNNDKKFFLDLLDNIENYKRNMMQTTIHNFCSYARTLNRPPIGNPGRIVGYFTLDDQETEIEEMLRRVEKVYDPVEPKNVCV